jgi:pyruvate,orthophosphate dikinase
MAQAPSSITGEMTTTSQRFIYDFDEPCAGGRSLLGGKGAGLAEMTALGAPVPAGFTITTDACRAFMAAGGDLPGGLEGEISDHVRRLEQKEGKRFGDPSDPLLLSVRSGAAISMPGMMDTILNLGLTDESVQGLARAPGNERFARDSYRRLIQMFGEVVDGIDAECFEHELAILKARRGAVTDVELTAADLAELIVTYLAIYRDRAGHSFPQNPIDQLVRAVRAVFESWDAPRAKVYRRAYEIADDLGTAVNVGRMVFGNKNEASATGVCFTRNPATGETGLYGEFLLDAQGEDVVAGIRTPEPISRLRALMPEAFDELVATMERLELHYRDMQDIEFTIEDGTLYLLQTRSGKRTAAAAVKVAVAMVAEGLIDREEAIRRIDPAQLDQLLHPTLDPRRKLDVAAVGLNASPGAAWGAVVLDADTAERRGKAGENVILVRSETAAADIHGLIQATGIVTAFGGITSHAAVVARGMGKPCVAGVDELVIDIEARIARFGGREVAEGETITIDGTAGVVMIGRLELVPARINEDFQTLLEWADGMRRLSVHANADSPADALKARELGAQGVGLCRTEHMFMAEERLPIVREMIMAVDEHERRVALDKLLPMQQTDFEGIFEAMAGLPVTIRLLDPPLHEFLPPAEEATDERMRERIAALHETNPMLGTRGCRLGLQWPEIYEMQVRAIVRAAKAVERRAGAAPQVEIMHPLIAFAAELARLRELTVRTVAEEGGLDYSCGTMIELPRACVRADEIAEHADFFSFGTNDLTQTALGFSRDDAEGTFLSHYLEERILAHDPFQTLDQSGVGDLMRIAVERGRAARPEIRLGICGEHGGDPASIAFCHRLGLDYVSCSPYRVPVARLVAAQAALAEAGVGAYAEAGG